jgi:hypothetical protein
MWDIYQPLTPLSQPNIYIYIYTYNHIYNNRHHEQEHTKNKHQE